MNHKFDELAEGLAQADTRRGALKKFGLGLAGIGVAFSALQAASRRDQTAKSPDVDARIRPTAVARRRIASPPASSSARSQDCDNCNERKSMNDKFDELAKGLAQSVTRRGPLKKFGAGLAGIALASLGLANWAQANPDDKGGKQFHCVCRGKADYGCYERYGSGYVGYLCTLYFGSHCPTGA
jgi:hypothetical protein